MSREEYPDAALEDDIPGNNRKIKQRAKYEVTLNYESDSSDEDYVKDDGKRDEDKSDDDMFASDNEDKKESKKNNSKEDDILDMNEFERNEGIDDYVEEIVRDDSGDAQEDAFEYYNGVENLEIEKEPLVKKPDIKLEAFNLREEANEGVFYKDGTYVKNKDEDEDESGDEWYKQYKKEDIEKAKESERERERKSKDKKLQQGQKRRTTEQLLDELIGILQAAETPLEAMARISPRKDKKKKNRELNGNSQSDQSSKELVFRITEICNALETEKAFQDPSLMSKEEFMRIYKAETGHYFKDKSRGTKRRLDSDSSGDEDDNNHSDDKEKIWEFKWKGDDTIHGPYSAYEMEHWKNNYFENNVNVRKLNSSEFEPIELVSFK